MLMMLKRRRMFTIQTPPGKGKNVKPTAEVPEPAAGSSDVADVTEELAKPQKTFITT